MDAEQPSLAEQEIQSLLARSSHGQTHPSVVVASIAALLAIGSSGYAYGLVQKMPTVPQTVIDSSAVLELRGRVDSLSRVIGELESRVSVIEEVPVEAVAARLQPYLTVPQLPSSASDVCGKEKSLLLCGKEK